MKATAAFTACLLAAVALTSCSKSGQNDAAAPHATTNTIAIVPFRAVGAAESGQYGLLLSNFSTVLATEFGARSDWQVVESQRIDTLREEQALEAPPASAGAAAEPSAEVQAADAPAGQDAAAPAPAEAATWAATFPSADYVLLGQINGFDVSPVDARAPGQTMARRQNRVRSRIDVRVVDVHTRAWVASRSVQIDENLGDESAAETQVNQAMSLAARKVVTAVLLAAARAFEISETKGDRVTLNGGSRQGVEAGQVFRVDGGDATQTSAQVRIVEAFPDRAIAAVVAGKVAAGDRVDAQPIAPVVTDALANGAEPRIAVGRFFLAESPEESSGYVIMEQVKQDLLTEFHHYSGLRVVEEGTENIKKLLSQQVLEDLSKGRDPGLPMGSLHGVDYLIFGNVRAFDTTPARREVTQMFGAAVIDDIPPRVLFDATVYILDVSRGEYITASDLSLDVDISGMTSSRAVANTARAIAAQMFSRTILEIRPLSILEVKDADIVLNHTSAAGLAIGDRFDVMSRGEDRLDPSTGTRMRNVGGELLGQVEIASFDAGGWAHASALDGKAPPVGSLLVRATADGDSRDRNRRKLNW